MVIFHPTTKTLILWKLLHIGLPIILEVQYRGVILYSMCSLGKSHEEPISHLFFECFDIVYVWTWLQKKFARMSFLLLLRTLYLLLSLVGALLVNRLDLLLSRFRFVGEGIISGFNKRLIHYKKVCMWWQLFSYKMTFINVTIYTCGGSPNFHKTGCHKV